MASNLRIGIVGGGLGGLTAAIQLQRSGFCALVFEQAPALTRVGAGIHLGPNVMRIMGNLGLERKLLDRALVPERRRSREWNTGRLLGEIVTRDMEQRYGATHVIMHRGDLIDCLASAVEEGTVAVGKRLIGLDPHGSNVGLIFADGSRTEVDLVIGADGINSTVRESLVGPEEPTYTGHVAYRSIFPSRLLTQQVEDSTKWWGTDRNIVIYYLSRTKDEIYFVTGVPEQRWRADSFSPQAADMNEVRDAFSGFHAQVQNLLAACPNATIWPILERDEAIVWSRDSIVLLGDACHPMRPHLGQGAAMAMEDGIMLARCLESAAHLPEALRLYELNRSARTALMQRESRVNTPAQYASDQDWIHAYDVSSVPLLCGAKSDIGFPSKAQTLS